MNTSQAIYMYVQELEFIEKVHFVISSVMWWIFTNCFDLHIHSDRTSASTGSNSRGRFNKCVSVKGTTHKRVKLEEK